MYPTVDERTLLIESERLMDMYHQDTKPHKLGRVMARHLSQRQKMIRVIRHLLEMVDYLGSQEMKETIPYKDAVDCLERLDLDQIFDLPAEEE